MSYESLDTGQRHVAISTTKTKIDYANFLANVLDQHYTCAKSVFLIQDNLGTHTKGSFYKAFDAPKARELARKIEFSRHYKKVFSSTI